MTHLRRTQLKFLLLWSVLLISFGTIALYLILSASGYKIDWKWFRIEKTGIITIKSMPKDVSVVIDTSLRAKSTPRALRNILPGTYDISLQKPQYQTWNKTVQVEPGKVTELDDIVLLRTNPIVEPVSASDKQLLDTYIRNDGVQKMGNEIFIKGATLQLVTRLSRDVTQAVIYSDKQHIIYQVGNDVKLSDLTGQHEQLITQLPSDHESQIISIENGKSVLIKQDTTYLRLTIG